MTKEEIIKEIQAEIKKDLQDQEIYEVFGTATEQFIKLYAEGILREKEKTEYGKEKAYIIGQYSNIARLECPKHDTHIERSFNPGDAIKERQCLTCKAQEAETIKKYARGIKCDLNKK